MSNSLQFGATLELPQTKSKWTTQNRAYTFQQNECSARRIIWSTNMEVKIDTTFFSSWTSFSIRNDTFRPNEWMIVLFETNNCLLVSRWRIIRERSFRSNATLYGAIDFNLLSPGGHKHLSDSPWKKCIDEKISCDIHLFNGNEIIFQKNKSIFWQNV